MAIPLQDEPDVAGEFKKHFGPHYLLPLLAACELTVVKVSPLTLHIASFCKTFDDVVVFPHAAKCDWNEEIQKTNADIEARFPHVAKWRELAKEDWPRLMNRRSEE